MGLLSSVIPYSCEMAALRTLPPSVFSILMSLEPAAAALAGMLVVGEFLTGVQWVALGVRRGGQHRRHPEPTDHRRAGTRLSAAVSSPDVTSW